MQEKIERARASSSIETRLAKPLRWVLAIWVVLGISALMAIAVELVWRGAQLLAAERTLPHHSVLASQAWGEGYYQDQKRYNYRKVFHPFVHFRPAAYASETINVSVEGIRHTPFNDGPDAPLRIAMFGGSTMIGAGVPDWGTIPARVAHSLRQAGVSHHVVNYGAGWFTSSQSVAQLIVVLRRGDRPTVVVFYDGINDVDVVSYGGRVEGIAPGIEAAMHRAFDVRPPTVAQFLAQNSLLVQWLVSKLRPAGKSAWTFRFPSEHIMKDRAEVIATTYEANVRLVTALGNHFQFVPYFFLQPMPLIAQKPLTDLEQRVIRYRQQRGPDETRLFELTYARLRTSPYLTAHPGFHNLEDLFARETRTLYLDSEHLLPEGNQLVAGAMVAAMPETKRAR